MGHANRTTPRPALVPGVAARHELVTAKDRHRHGPVEAFHVAMGAVQAEYEAINRLRGPDKDNWTAHLILSIERTP